MKKNLTPRTEPAVDYEVGLVSGSLSKSGAGSGSLSALFTTSTPSTKLFQPAPEVVKSVESKGKVKEVGAQKKVQVKEAPEAESRVQDREQGLQLADEAEQNRVGSRKRKQEDEDGPEVWVKRRQKLKENKQKERARDTRTVFVGNLPLSSTKKTLRVLFKDKGPIESIRFRSLVREDPSISQRVAAIMRKAHPQKQSINAYVVFKEEESAASALDRNGLEVAPDLFIRVDRLSSSHDHKRSVFVGNLPFDLKEASLRRHFDDCGVVEGVRLIRDSKSGLGKGFGYLLFQDADSVQLALKLDGSKLEGRSIRVKRSVQPDKLKTHKRHEGKNRRHRDKARPGATPGARPGATPGQFRGEMADPTKKKNKKFTKKFTKTKDKGKKAAAK